MAFAVTSRVAPTSPISTASVAVIVIFQPELRRMLAELGRFRFWTNTREERQNIEVVVEAAERMADVRIGMLTAIEQSIPLRDVVETGVLVDCQATPEMLEAMYRQAEHYLALTERLFRRWGHRLVLAAPGAPAGLLGPATGLIGIEVNVRIERFTARGPEDIETLAREIGRHVARELRLRGVMVA